MKVTEAEKVVSEELVGKNGRSPGEDAAVVLYQELRAVRKRLEDAQARIASVAGAAPKQRYEHKAFEVPEWVGYVVEEKEKEGWELVCLGTDCVWMRRPV